MQQILDGKSHELESDKFKDMEHPIKTEDTMSTDIPKKENKLSFTQRIAKFFEKHKPLMKYQIMESFENYNLYRLLKKETKV